jgi:hypothetical protein
LAFENRTTPSYFGTSIGMGEFCERARPHPAAAGRRGRQNGLATADNQVGVRHQLANRPIARDRGGLLAIADEVID